MSEHPALWFAVGAAFATAIALWRSTRPEPPFVRNCRFSGNSSEGLGDSGCRISNCEIDGRKVVSPQ